MKLPYSAILHFSSLLAMVSREREREKFVCRVNENEMREVASERACANSNDIAEQHFAYLGCT